MLRTLRGPTAPYNPPPVNRPATTSRVLIEGFGLVSPLGLSAWETFTALTLGRTLADRAERLPPDVAPADLVRALGCVASAQHSSTDPSVELAERAAREAMFGMPGAASAPPPSVAMPVYIGASKGAVRALDDAAAAPDGFDSHARSGAARTMRTFVKDRALAVALGPSGYLAHHLQRRLPIADATSVVAACASSLTALHHARMRLLHDPGSCPGDRLLVVTSEAALLPLFIHSYRRLGVLPPTSVEGYVGRPLDRRRNGFMLAELGAAVVLRRVDADTPITSSRLELLDTAIAADGFDVVRGDPAMPALRRVSSQILSHGGIDVLHPHATGTAEHDAAEMSVYEDALGLSRREEHGNAGAAEAAPPQSTPPLVYACKGALGHGLGAAGLVSLVLACVIAKARRVPPMPWLDEPIDSPLLSRDTPRPAHSPLARHAVFAAGFGGHVAGAVIERCDQRK